MSGQMSSDPKVLKRPFSNRGIPTDQIAFHNHPRFLAVERQDPSFLDLYAAWVRSRPRASSYEERVRRVVPLVADVIAREIVRDGQLGVCIDASMMLTKILEEEGVWCYAAKGALTIETPTLGDPTHFWMIDEKEVAGHVWVVAPPFEVVDATLQA